MAHTLPPVTQVLILEQSALARFRRALRRADQGVLDDLLDVVQGDLSVSADVAHILPFEMLLLFLLLAEGEEVLRLRQEIDSRSDTAQQAAAHEPALWLFPARTPQDG